MTDDTVAESAPTTWRDLAVARSLDPARVRAEKRVQRFLDAALELMTTSSDKEFTVQEVVEKSGQSLRSFYQYFAGKYELLLALFEESVRSSAEHLEEVVAQEDDPLERLHLFVIEHYRVCQPAPKSRSNKKGLAPAMAPFAQQLLTEHPKEASHAFVPHGGAARADPRRRRGGRRDPVGHGPPPDGGRRAPGRDVQRLRHHDQRHPGAR